MPDKIRRETTIHPDGSRTESYEVQFNERTMRPLNDDAIGAIDAALEHFGEPIEPDVPLRMVSFEEGGPPVWSIKAVQVPGERPSWLLLTYGFSTVVSPDPRRQPCAFEYSIAVPDTEEDTLTWAGTLVGGLCGEMLLKEEALAPGDSYPFNPNEPFPAAHFHLPEGAVGRVLVTKDPLLPNIDTPAGELEVRRLVTVGPQEGELLETWSEEGLIEELARVDPLLLSEPGRGLLADPAVRQRCEARARAEGGKSTAIVANIGWFRTDDGVLNVRLPGGSLGALTYRCLAYRLPFGRLLMMRGEQGTAPVIFKGGPEFSIGWDEVGADRVLVITGQLDDEQMRVFLEPLWAEAETAVVRFNPESTG